jgi:hypothetical protein
MGRDPPGKVLWHIRIWVAEPTDDEFVSAESSNDVRRSGGVPQGFGHRSDSNVAAFMANRIID